MKQPLSGLYFYRGRVALYAILKALGLGPGDEVAIQAFTCVAVPEAVMAARARPRYVDIGVHDFNMAATDLQRKLTSATRAIIVQHTYGIPADLDPILQVATEARLPIIEDCCHSLASTYKGKTTGSFGVASFYSYEWGKPIVAGIGGSAVIEDPELRERVRKAYGNYRTPRALRLARIQLQFYAFGLLYRPSLYWPVRSLFHRLSSLGMAERNYNPVSEGAVAEDFSLRMSPAVQRRLSRSLANLDIQTRHCRSVVGEYQARIRSAVVAHPILPAGSDTVFARYPLLTRTKPELLRAARRANVELSEWYATPVHPLVGEELRRAHYEQGSCPNAEARCNEVVALPTHPAVSEHDVDRSIQFLNEVTL